MAEDLVTHLTKRIDILVKEIENLTEIVNKNVVEQSDQQKQYNELLAAFQKSEQNLKQTEEKLSQAFKQSLQANLERLKDDKESISKLLQDSRAEVPTGTQHPLYILCQEKINIEQQLRARINELEKSNAVLHSENARLRSFIQQDRMFQQMESLSGKGTQPQQNQIYPQTQRNPTELDPLSPKNIIQQPMPMIYYGAHPQPQPQPQYPQSQVQQHIMRVPVQMAPQSLQRSVRPYQDENRFDSHHY